MALWRFGGTAYGPIDRESAFIDASYTAGVKNVIDNIQVAPVSMMDDRIRVATARAVYGFPSLNKYAIDPVKPIRIVVQNGNVMLEGMVISQTGQGKSPDYAPTAVPGSVQGHQ